MKFRAIDRKLVRDMARMRGHLAAIALVAACGAATQVTMRGSYEALAVARDRFYREYRFADLFVSLERAPRSVLPRIERIPGVAAVEDGLEQQVSLSVRGFREPVTALVLSVPEGRRPAVNDLLVLAGRYVGAGSTGDVGGVPGAAGTALAHEVLVSEAFAEAHGLTPGDSLAGAIHGRWQELRVVGTATSPEFVYVLGGAGVFPDDERYGVLWRGRQAMAAALDLEDGFNRLSIRLAPGADARRVIEELDALLSAYGSPGAYGREDQVSHLMLDSEIEQDRVTGIVMPAVFLAVAAFLIYNALTRLIVLQRPQIGLLRSFGYPSGTLARHYVVLALGATLLGCGVGIAAGTWLGHGLAEVYQRFFHLPGLAFRLSAQNISAVIASCATAGVAGSLPAVARVLRLPPAEAMRPEPAPQFRPQLLERLGAFDLLSPAVRMLVRNLERRPFRAGASLLAVSLAVSLLVVSQFGLDSLDETVRVQFGAARSDDVQLAFDHPLPPSVRHELTRLPGVWQSEAMRSVPVKLRHGHRTKRATLSGLPSRAELRRVLDVHGRPVAIPVDGIVLGRSLAALLDVAPGGTVSIEFLHGRRVTRDVTVVGTLDEPLGLAGYTDERALAGWMGEDLAYTDAYLRVDPRELERLYETLIELPAVAAVTLREATLRSFLATVAENLLVSLTILIAFACAIAAGVVYNGARIALSEHALTLASLRTLGFTQREVTTILLGEQAVLVALALPLGCAVGYGLCAWMSHLLQTEMYRLPLVVSARTYLGATGTVVVAALASGGIVAWQLRRLDLVSVLKTRE